MIVKCNYCGESFEKSEGIRYNNKNYHINCVELKCARDELNDYICKLFGFKRVGPRINTQIADYKTKFNLSDQQILQILKYHYDICHGSLEKANGGVGIIPYVYEDALKYYNTIENKQDKILSNFEKNLQNHTPAQKLKIIKKNRVTREFIDE